MKSNNIIVHCYYVKSMMWLVVFLSLCGDRAQENEDTNGVRTTKLCTLEYIVQVSSENRMYLVIQSVYAVIAWLSSSLASIGPSNFIWSIEKFFNLFESNQPIFLFFSPFFLIRYTWPKANFSVTLVDLCLCGLFYSELNRNQNCIN